MNFKICKHQTIQNEGHITKYQVSVFKSCHSLKGAKFEELSHIGRIYWDVTE